MFKLGPRSPCGGQKIEEEPTPSILSPVSYFTGLALLCNNGPHMSCTHMDMSGFPGSDRHLHRRKDPSCGVRGGPVTGVPENL